MENADAQNQKLNIEQIFGQAEESLRQSLQTLTEWGDQARDILNNRPGVVLASLSIAGFMTGLMLRRGAPLFRRGSFSADPMIVFLTGAFVGATIGPRIMREVIQGTDATVTSLDRGAETS